MYALVRSWFDHHLTKLHTGCLLKDIMLQVEGKLHEYYNANIISFKRHRCHHKIMLRARVDPQRVVDLLLLCATISHRCHHKIMLRARVDPQRVVLFSRATTGLQAGAPLSLTGHGRPGEHQYGYGSVCHL